MAALPLGRPVMVAAGSAKRASSVIKISGGRRIFKCAPIHHHFHLRGWTEQQVVVRFWLLSALFVAIALATIKLR